MRLAHPKYRLTGDEAGIAAYLHISARIMLETGNTLMGIDSHERALRVVRRTGKTGLEVTFLFRAGEAYQLAAEYGKAAAYYREALSLARDPGDTTAEGHVLVLLGSPSFDRDPRIPPLAASALVHHTRHHQTADGGQLPDVGFHPLGTLHPRRCSSQQRAPRSERALTPPAT